MVRRFGNLLFVMAAVGGLAVTAQTTSPSTVAGKPNLTGLWQSLGTADWDIQAHGAQAGPFNQLGAIGAIPPGQGIVVGEEIPYLPEALAQKKKNLAERWKLDPVVRCYMPGVPRATYMAFPFQIIESQKDILIAYEFASVNRLINMGKPQEAAVDTWMGTSNGHWDGNTLVVETTGFKDGLWLDVDGTPASKNAKLTMRIRKVKSDHWFLQVEFTLDDPTYYTHPWSWMRDYSWRPDMTLFHEYNCELQTGAKDGIDPSLVPEPQD
jgi:hypothetical protein